MQSSAPLKLSNCSGPAAAPEKLVFWPFEQVPQWGWPLYAALRLGTSSAKRIDGSGGYWYSPVHTLWIMLPNFVKVSIAARPSSAGVWMHASEPPCAAHACSQCACVSGSGSRRMHLVVFGALFQPGGHSVAAPPGCTPHASGGGGGDGDASGGEGGGCGKVTPACSRPAQLFA